MGYAPHFRSSFFAMSAGFRSGPRQRCRPVPLARELNVDGTRQTDYFSTAFIGKVNIMKRSLAAIAIFFLGVFPVLISACANSSQDASGAKDGRERAVPVTAATVIRKEMPIEIKTFGNVQAKSSVQIKAEVDGALAKVHFRKGQNIRRGDLLFSIDPRSYQAALAQAQANLLRDRALLEHALLTAKRARELLQRGYIARSDFDKAQSEADALSATIKADEAAIAHAKLQVERCSIRSPINGKAGDLLVSEGALIKAKDMTMVVINQLRPIEVFFSIPQADLPAVRSEMSQRKLKVKAYLPKDNRPPEEGELFFIDNAIDKSTGSVQLAGTFDNERDLLWPGQYVLVTLVLAVQKDALVVPSIAVQNGQEGGFVFVVKPDRTVEVRPVTTRMAAGEETVIEKGLQAGEQVVTDGHLGLVPGTRIEIKNPASDKADGAIPQGRS